MDILLGFDLGWCGARLGLLVCSGVLSSSSVTAQGEEVSLNSMRRCFTVRDVLIPRIFGSEQERRRTTLRSTLRSRRATRAFCKPSRSVARHRSVSPSCDRANYSVCWANLCAKLSSMIVFFSLAEILATEMMALLLSLWTALLLGILYLFFNAIPLVFRGNHGL
jgi:hypothetical protein